MASGGNPRRTETWPACHRAVSKAIEFSITASEMRPRHVSRSPAEMTTLRRVLWCDGGRIEEQDGQRDDKWPCISVERDADQAHDGDPRAVDRRKDGEHARGRSTKGDDPPSDRGGTAAYRVPHRCAKDCAGRHHRDEGRNVDETPRLLLEEDRSVPGQHRLAQRPTLLEEIADDHIGDFLGCHQMQEGIAVDEGHQRAASQRVSNPPKASPAGDCDQQSRQQDHRQCRRQVHRALDVGRRERLESLASLSQADSS